MSKRKTPVDDDDVDEYNHFEDKVRTPELVTPSPQKNYQKRNDVCAPRKQQRIVSGEVVSPVAKRELFGPIDDNEAEQEEEYASLDSSSENLKSDDPPLSLTQDVEYSQDLEAGLPPETNSKLPFAYLKDVYDPTRESFCMPDGSDKSSIKIGRRDSCDLVIKNKSVSGQHCELFPDDYSNTCKLFAYKTCWVYSNRIGNTWKEVFPKTSHTLLSDDHIRFLPPGNTHLARQSGQEFRLFIIQDYSEDNKSGTNSFDHQYMQLLKVINFEGKPKQNKKGPNLTLERPYTLAINLSDEDDRYLLPITSLRNMFGGRPAIVEAMWYLRGEDHVRFLQANNCRFWDKQCKDDGYVGYNYGLLTNFPIVQKDGATVAINQLEEKIIDPLCKEGSSSRNMVCTLMKPGEPTEQPACTASIQFSVSSSTAKLSDRSQQKMTAREVLNLTVNQRSSDVILGLPHDVIAWSIMLHLVRREVFIRTNGRRNLAAGKLYFIIASGGAHIYNLNSEGSAEIQRRVPIEGCNPVLSILDCNSNLGVLSSTNTSLQQRGGMFSLAKNYRNESMKVIGYGTDKHHLRIKLSQATE